MSDFHGKALRQQRLLGALVSQLRAKPQLCDQTALRVLLGRDLTGLERKAVEIATQSRGRPSELARTSTRHSERARIYRRYKGAGEARPVDFGGNQTTPRPLSPRYVTVSEGRVTSRPIVRKSTGKVRWSDDFPLYLLASQGSREADTPLPNRPSTFNDTRVKAYGGKRFTVRRLPTAVESGDER